MEILQACVKRSSNRQPHALHHLVLGLFFKGLVPLYRPDSLPWKFVSKTKPRQIRHAGMALHRKSAATNHAGVIRFVVLFLEKLQEVARISQGRVFCPFHLDGLFLK